MTSSMCYLSGNGLNFKQISQCVCDGPPPTFDLDEPPAIIGNGISVIIIIVVVLVIIVIVICIIIIVVYVIWRTNRCPFLCLKRFPASKCKVNQVAQTTEDVPYENEKQNDKNDQISQDSGVEDISQPSEQNTPAPELSKWMTSGVHIESNRLPPI
ncbi:uncharacterized protein LOC144446315 [Glandiceps talaboti]